MTKPLSGVMLWENYLRLVVVMQPDTTRSYSYNLLQLTVDYFAIIATPRNLSMITCFFILIKE